MNWNSKLDGERRKMKQKQVSEAFYHDHEHHDGDDDGYEKLKIDKLVKIINNGFLNEK